MLDPAPIQRRRMTNMPSKVAVVIATYNRPKSLVKVLEALEQQTLTPDIVVVVDASPTATESLPEFLSSFTVTYLKSTKGSLPAQKNLAIDYLLENWSGDFVQILDDDTFPKSTFLETLAAFLSANPNAVGASGFCISESPDFVSSVFLKKIGIPGIKQKIYSILGLDGLEPGRVVRGGIGIFADPSEPISRVEWLHGTSMYRFTLFDHISYLGSLPGSALCEDLDFSTKALEYGQLFSISEARIEHEMSSDNRPNWPLHYYRFARNRLFLFQPPNNLKLKLRNYVLTNLFIAAVLLGRGFVSKKNRDLIQSAVNIIRGMIDGFRNKEPR